MRDWSDWPTMAAYLAWAKASGCTVTLSAPNSDLPGAYRLATIISPRGASAVEVFAEEDEPLMSTSVARLDRRLGLKSRLFV
jgi:hypothetical protein